MVDSRVALKNGETLVFEDGKSFLIEKEVGRGGSCLVYDAAYLDNRGMSHRVRVKECYPYVLDLSREKDGSLRVPEQAREQFETEKQSFLEAYEKCTEIRNTMGLMNSTVNPMDVCNANQTVYTVMECNEAQNYATYMEEHPEESLPSFFTRMKTLALVIDKYHQYGVLHLDIKPSNMLVIPETKEHILLFDFDSLIREEELKGDGPLRLSVSEGFAAPEQRSGQREKIGRYTDIYAIGAIVYRKLFGKEPDAMKEQLDASYDYDTMLHKEKKYPSVFFDKLDRFFHKTIAAATAVRWKDMQDVIASLDELIDLSDTEKVRLYDNFNYSFEGFVGRGPELENLGRRLTEKRVVFLSGIGGIGKTELAKRYAYENRDSFRTVVFAPFAGSVVNTVCGDDFYINDGGQPESMSVENYFEHKWKMIKELVQENDLIILDNFDVEDDENLGRFISELPCRLIVTTRSDFSDRNLLQVPVERMENMEDLLHLFATNNEREYAEEEKEYIRKIIELVDGHTMTVDMLAKYMRDSEETPENLYEKLREKEGLASANEVQVDHDKDNESKTESIYIHLLSLFDLSGFTEQEEELLMSLSLFGFVRIKKKKFLEWCDVEGNKEALRHLVKRGWIQSDKESGKIALHQIILDMVYNHLQPTSEKCPHIVASMLRYMEEDLKNYGQQWKRLLMVNDVLKRIKGEDESYFKLMVAGCRMFFAWSVKDEFTEAVKNEALSHLDKLMDGLSEGDLWERNLELWAQCIVLGLRGGLERSGEWDLEETEEVLEQLTVYAEGADVVITIDKDLPVSPECKVNCLWETAEITKELYSKLQYTFFMENPNAENLLLAVVKKCLDRIEKYIAGEEFDHRRMQYYATTEEFYRDHGFKNLGGSRVRFKTNRQIVQNAKKVIYFQKKQKKGYADTMADVWEWFAFSCKLEDDLPKALDFYLKAYHRRKLNFWEKSYSMQTLCTDIAGCYKELGKVKRAIRMLVWTDKRYGLDENDYAMLISLLKQEGRERKAKKYEKRKNVLVEENLAKAKQKKEQEPEDEWNDTEIKHYQEWQLVDLLQTYELADTEEEKTKIWKECLLLYKELASESGVIEDDLMYGEREAGVFAFYRLYLRRLMQEEVSSKESIKQQMDIMLQLLKERGWREEEKEQVGALFKKLKVKYSENVKGDAYLSNYLKYLEIQYLSNCSDASWAESVVMAAECDLCILTTRHAEGKDNEKKLELWENTNWEIDLYEKTEGKETCFENQFAVFEPVLGLLDMEKSVAYWRPSDSREADEYDVEKNVIFYYWTKVQERLDNLIHVGDKPKMEELVGHYYEKLTQYYGYELFSKEEAESWQEMFLGWKEYEKGNYGESVLYETHNQEHARRVANLGYYVRSVDMYRPAAILALVGLYISLTEEPDKEFLRAAYPERDGSIELLAEKVGDKLKQKADPRFIPVVCERIERILTWFPEDEDLQPLKQGMEGFLARYQELEF